MSDLTTYTPEQASELIGGTISPAMLRRLARRGEIAHIIGPRKAYLFRRAHLEAFLEQNTNRPTPAPAPVTVDHPFRTSARSRRRSA